MNIVMLPRGKGKTTALLQWVSHGKKVPGYPGWSRVGVLFSYNEVARSGKQTIPGTEKCWREMEDWPHRVYAQRDWNAAMGVDPGTEVMIDDVDRYPMLPGRLVGVTISTEKHGR